MHTALKYYQNEFYITFGNIAWDISFNSSCSVKNQIELYNITHSPNRHNNNSFLEFLFHTITYMRSNICISCKLCRRIKIYLQLIIMT